MLDLKGPGFDDTSGVALLDLPCDLQDDEDEVHNIPAGPVASKSFIKGPSDSYRSGDESLEIGAES